MRVVHVNFDAATNGGASIAMLRIHKALRGAGVDSQIVCRKLPNDPYSVAYKMPLWRRVGELGYKALLRYVLCAKHESAGLYPTGMADLVNRLNPDIVQLNWLQANTISIRELAKFKCPIVWFTHDCWPMFGIYPCSKTDWFKKGPPTEGPLINRIAWQNKCNVVKRLKGRLYVVSPSEWAMKEAQESIVFKDVPCFCIHYPATDSLVAACEQFAGKDKPKNDRFTILFGATTGISAPVKGWDRLMSAIDMLTDEQRANICIRVFGCHMQNQKMHGVDVSFLGKLNQSQLIPEYRQADLFAFPSRSETWGQTKTEALCCGTPVIAFDQTACANGVRHKENGWVASANDIASFAAGLQWFYDLWRNACPLTIADEIKSYRPEAIAAKWLDLYNHIFKEVEHV